MKRRPAGSGPTIDPITFEVIGNALASIGDEMALTVMRTAYSGIVKDALDYSTALCDRNGQMIAQGLTIVLHLGSFPSAVHALREKFAGRIYPEDVFILNDPYSSGGIHLPDIYIIKPVFIDGAIEAFSCVLAHHTDVGGLVPGSNSTDSREIYHDGLRIPTVKLYERGMPNDAVFEIIAQNVRVPVKVLGDIRATLAAAAIGEREYIALADRYGAAVLRTYTDELLDYTERMARAEISALPDGVYEFTDYIDGDGSQAGEVTLHVRLTIDGDTIEADFEGSSPQVRAGINAPIANTVSATGGALRLIMDANIPNSAGYFRPLTVRAPLGSIVNSVEPAPCGARGITGFRIMDTVLGALAQAAPEKVPAGGEGGNTILSMGGYDENHRPFVYVDLVAGGRGGAPWGDGIEGIPHPCSNIANTPIELIETELPIRVEEYSLLPDTGGAGKYRGAIGQVRQVRCLAKDAVLQIRSDKRAHLPYPLHGGRPGTPSLNILNPGPNERLLPTLAVDTMCEGDVLRHVLAGGAGWGDPLDRDVALVEDDVRNEKISVGYALREYGVVIDPVSLSADLEATDGERLARRPLTPGPSPSRGEGSLIEVLPLAP